MERFKERLLAVEHGQRLLAAEYRRLLDDYAAQDGLLENERLRSQVEEWRQRAVALDERSRRLEQENVRLRTALADQLVEERLSLLKTSKRKLDAYFGQHTELQMNRLVYLEQNTRRRLDTLLERVDGSLAEEREELGRRIQKMADEVSESTTRQRARLEQERQALQADAAAAYGDLASDGISDEAVRLTLEHNRLEMKLGLGWLNKLGILLIVLGVGAAFKYSYSAWFTGPLKSAAFFLLGLLLLAGGEWLFRKGKRTFALGLIGGGISVLYGSVFYSYFLLHVFSLYVGLSLAVALSVLAVALSLRHRSRTVCALGLVGGYLPLFSYMWVHSLSGGAVYAAMSYLLLLNLGVLIVSLGQRWPVVTYISFVLHMPSMIMLTQLSDSHWINLFEISVTFVLYLGITFAYPLYGRSRLTVWDVLLLAFNTCINCALLYDWLQTAGFGAGRGALAAAFALLYGGLGLWVQRRMPQEKALKLLLYATALTFTVLVVPFQFSIRWLSLGWLVEGTALTVLGHRYGVKLLERAGWGVFLLCLAVFYNGDFAFLLLLDRNTALFHWKFSFVTGCMLLITLMYAYRQKQGLLAAYLQPVEIRLFACFKYAALLDCWLYALYETHHLYAAWAPRMNPHFTFYEQLIAALVTLLCAYGLEKAALLRDRVVDGFALALNAAGCFGCLYMTAASPVLQTRYADNGAMEYTALALLAGFNVLAFLRGRGLVQSLLSRWPLKRELYPVAQAVYVLGMLTVSLHVQLRLGGVSLLLSLLYLALALAYIAYGFRRRYIYIRRLGLGLTLLALGKLLLFDLRFLSSGSRIAAYFVFGAALLGISFLYQKAASRQGQHDD